MKRRCHRFFAPAALFALVLSGCSIKRAAVDWIGDALAGGGGAYTTDDDPELIREALPFGLKTFETLLETSPRHDGLLLAAARGFTAYAFLIQDEADRLDESDFHKADALRARSARLYLRARDYALRGLDARHSGFTVAMRQDRAAAFARTNKGDAPFLYWAGAAWAGAISAAKNDPALIVDLPLAGALVGRVLELDDGYDLGAAAEFFISFEAGRPGGSLERAREHYRCALELSGGKRASVYLALAESVSVREQKLAEFRELLAAARAVDPAENPELRLVNTIARRRAARLEARADSLFFDAGA